MGVRRATSTPLLSTPAGGAKAFTQGNGDTGAGVARSNGYTCRACSQLSAHQHTSAHALTHGLASRVYSRDHTQKRESRASPVLVSQAAAPRCCRRWPAPGSPVKAARRSVAAPLEFRVARSGCCPGRGGSGTL